MALSFLNLEVSELCLGKPQVKWVAATATVADAFRELNKSGDTHLSIWICGGHAVNSSCVCVGKFCSVDLILFLCRDHNLADPFKAIEAPLSDILPKASAIVTHLQPNYSLLEAMDYIVEGTQNLVIPIRKQNSIKKPHSGQPPCSCCHEVCWLTQEDVVRFLLNAVGAFSPIPTSPIDSLNIINHDIMTVGDDKPASSALTHFHRAHTEQSSVAVVDEDSRLLGEISPLTLACCDETAAGAIMTLSAIDLMTYIDFGGPPEELVQLVKMRLKERNLGAMVELIDEIFNSSTPSSSSSNSSDEDYGPSRNRGWSRYCLNKRYETIICSPKSTLVAVMIKALAHRVNYVWVVEEDHTLIGIVTFAQILNLLRSFASGMPLEMDKSFK